MPNVKIPSSFRHYTDGNSEVEVAGATAGETIGNVSEEYPGSNIIFTPATANCARPLTSTRLTRTSVISTYPTQGSQMSTSSPSSRRSPEALPKDEVFDSLRSSFRRCGNY